MSHSTLFPDFTSFDIVTDAINNIVIHGVKSNRSDGPPLLLMHGCPQTLSIWHAVASQLISHYTIVAIDIRGYGASSKPPTTTDHAFYSKSNMALDALAVMNHFGYNRFFVCAHDRGARVAHQLCVNHPEAVTKVMLLDICPTLTMYNQTTREFAQAYWHWFFLSQPAPAPEMFLKGVPARQWLGMMMHAKNSTGQSVFKSEAFEDYVRGAESEGALAAYCEDYRAAATVDCEEQKRDREAGRKVKCDVRVLWGKKGVIEKYFNALEDWKEVCDGEVSGSAVDSDHYIPEEVPDDVVANIKEFFV